MFWTSVTTVVSLFLMHIVGSSSQSMSYKCPENSHSATNTHLLHSTCYKIETFHVVYFKQARQECERINGGTLAVIPSAEVNNFLWGRLKNTYGSSTIQDAWIGLTDSNREGVFRWVDNSPVSYTNWHEGEGPVEHPGDLEDCVSLSPNDGKWSDVQCNGGLYNHFPRRPYICQYSAVLVQTPTTTTEQPPISTTPLISLITSAVKQTTAQVVVGSTTSTELLVSSSLSSSPSSSPAPPSPSSYSSSSATTAGTLTTTTVELSAVTTVTNTSTSFTSPSELPSPSPWSSTTEGQTATPSSSPSSSSSWPSSSPSLSSSSPSPSSPPPPTSPSSSASPSPTPKPTLTSTSPPQPTFSSSLLSSSLSSSSPSSSQFTSPAKSTTSSAEVTDCPPFACQLDCGMDGYKQDSQGCSLCLCDN